MNELKRLQAHHHKIIELALGGHKRKDIAQVMDMTPEGITLIMRSPIFQDELARRKRKQETLQDENAGLMVLKAKERLEESALDAAETMIDGLENENPKIALDSAKYIIDQTLGKTQQSSAPAIVINAETAQLLALTMQESNTRA